MIIDHLNLNQVRVFECVYRTRSMTLASQELHLTQSGVSQHVKALEDVLGIRLFDRIKQRLVPTASGTTLYQHCSKSLNDLEAALFEVKEGGKQLAGLVSVGMPIEFGNNVILPLLASFSKKNPLVRFKLKLGYASAMNEQILRGALDFAFVDWSTMDRRIRMDEVFDETLELCISEAALKAKGPPPKGSFDSKDAKAVRERRRYFESLDYVEYQDEEPFLRMWFEHHLGSRNLAITVKATVMDVQGVARLIEAGMGAGVLPGYIVTKLQKEGHDLHRFKGGGKPLKNTISMAHLPERTYSPAAAAALDYLRESLGGKRAGQSS